MDFLIRGEKRFKTYNEIWEKVSNIIKKEFNSDILHNRKYLKVEEISSKEGLQCNIDWFSL